MMTNSKDNNNRKELLEKKMDKITNKTMDNIIKDGQELLRKMFPEINNWDE